jgi:hypothetical protein
MFLADGTPGGLVTAEIMNWTGHVMAAPRSELRELLNREEAKRTGLYILLGEDPDALGERRAYVGEGDNVGRRLDKHSRSEEQSGKAFWDRAVILTSKDMNLTKAHVRYLESRFIQLARDAKRASLENGTAPATQTLPEADVSDMEYFIEQSKIVLPVLGVNLFRAGPTPQARRAPEELIEPSTAGAFELHFKKDDISASAEEIDGEFFVLKGSEARRSWVGIAGRGYSKLRSKLEEDEVLVPNAQGTKMLFAQDYAFASPSAAAATVVGRAANGPENWTHKASGLSYAKWQDQGLERAVEGDNGE